MLYGTHPAKHPNARAACGEHAGRSRRLEEGAAAHLLLILHIIIPFHCMPDGILPLCIRKGTLFSVPPIKYLLSEIKMVLSQMTAL